MLYMRFKTVNTGKKTKSGRWLKKIGIFF